MDILKPNFLVIECTSTWSGAYSYVLTSCTDEQKVEEVCESASEALEENEGQSIDFSIQALKQFIEDSCILEEIKDGDRDGFDEVDPEKLTVTNIFLPENVSLLYEMLNQLFETGYENGIISDYIECDEVPVLLVSQ